MRHRRGARQFRDAWPRGALFRQSADAKSTVPVAEDFRQLAPRLASLRRLPAGQRLVRLRRRRIHHLLMHAGAGGQLDDVSVRVAEIGRADKAMVDRAAHLFPFRLRFCQHRFEDVVVDAERAMCRSSVSCRLNSNGLPGASKNARHEPSAIWKKVCKARSSSISTALTSGRPKNSS